MYDETLDGKLIICEAYLQGGRDETPDGQPTTYMLGGDSTARPGDPAIKYENSS